MAKLTLKLAFAFLLQVSFLSQNSSAQFEAASAPIANPADARFDGVTKTQGEKGKAK